MHYAGSVNLSGLVMPTNFQNAQMATENHKTKRTIYRSLFVAWAAQTKGCYPMSFAQSIISRFAAQSFNMAKFLTLGLAVGLGLLIYSIAVRIFYFSITVYCIILKSEFCKSKLTEFILIGNSTQKI